MSGYNTLADLTPNAKLAAERGRVSMADRIYWMEYYWKRYDKHTRELTKLEREETTHAQARDWATRWQMLQADLRDTKQLAIWYQLLMYEQEQEFDLFVQVYLSYIESGDGPDIAGYKALDAVEKLLEAAKEGTTV